MEVKRTFATLRTAADCVTITDSAGVRHDIRGWVTERGHIRLEIHTDDQITRNGKVLPISVEEPIMPKT